MLQLIANAMQGDKTIQQVWNHVQPPLTANQRTDPFRNSREKILDLCTLTRLQISEFKIHRLMYIHHKCLINLKIITIFNENIFNVVVPSRQIEI